MTSTPIKLKPTPYGSIHIVAYRPEYHANKSGEYEEWVDSRQTLQMVRRKSTWVLCTNKARRLASATDTCVHDGHHYHDLIVENRMNNGNGYMKEVEFIIVKVKPAIADGIYRFEVIDSSSSALELVRKYNTRISYSNTRTNVYDTTYMIAMRGIKISRSEWLENALAEEKHHATMRKIFKMPNVWRSYPNLYPVAKEKIPHFESGGSVLNEQSIPETSIPFPSPNDLRLARRLTYVNYQHGYGSIRPTFDSPNVNSWEGHGYQQLA